MQTQDHKTKDFLNKIDELISRGIIKDHAEVVNNLNWNKSVMSSVKNKKLPVPQHIYNKFNTTYAEQLRKITSQDLQPSDKDYKDKYIALLEKQAKDYELISKRITAIEMALNEAKRNQQVMYSVQLAYQESVLPVIGRLGNVKSIEKEAGKKAVAYLEKFQKEGVSSLS